MESAQVARLAQHLPVDSGPASSMADRMAEALGMRPPDLHKALRAFVSVSGACARVAVACRRVRRSPWPLTLPVLRGRLLVMLTRCWRCCGAGLRALCWG